MDRHSEKRETKKELPVNIRAVGMPGGQYLLYLEDYVHTFMQKLLEETQPNQECAAIVYGYEFDEEERHYYVVSGAVSLEEQPEHCFSEQNMLGRVLIRSGKDTDMRIELLLPSQKHLVLDHYFIYYDQNEEMQNYLITWNLEHQGQKARVEWDEAVRYGRMAQAYNKEEVKVNFLWNIMNVLSLGFVICVMVYGILSVNHYHKMKDMEHKLEYIVSVMANGTQDITLASWNQQAVQEETEDFMQLESSQPETHEEETLQTEALQTQEVLLIPEPTTQMQEPDAEQESETLQQPTSEEVAAQPVSQYYIVQQGDTLRSISYAMYGNYDMVTTICQRNQIENPDSILYGQKLLLP